MPRSVEMIEADRNYVIIRVGKDSFHARSTLQQAEHSLRSQPMLRISRSCLVNMNFVKEVNRTLRGDFMRKEPRCRAAPPMTSSEEASAPRSKDSAPALVIAAAPHEPQRPCVCR